VITLERARLVNWHNFEDQLIEIGDRCLLAGDNGSGKSTIIDAIQYALAASLRMAKFNSAAEERRGGGRDLMAYVRCKIGSETTEYRRGDTVAHIMLEWSGPSNDSLAKLRGVADNAGFSCGVCVEAYRDNHYTEHFWVGSGLSIRDMPVRSGQAPLLFRQFKNVLSGLEAAVYDAKRLYIRDLTNRLGVFRRQPETNPYLDSLTRSIGFKPLDSIDQFVCDFILEENPVDIQVMKQNLENYKEADRQARGAAAKITFLRKICAKAAEWRNYDGLILKQEYLKLRIEEENERQKKEKAARALAETEEELLSTARQISSLNQKRLDIEMERRALDISLAANDAHRLFQELQSRIGRIRADLGEEEKKADRYRDLKSQCRILAGRPLSEDFDKEAELEEAEAKMRREERYGAQRKKEEAAALLKDSRQELADLERGILRFPDAPRELRLALEQAGIQCFFLAEAAEILDPQWADAVEGWLNTRRFAILVDPEDFQGALEIYDRLPRSVAGAFLPNIEKMRSREASNSAPVRPGSLAELVKADAYARIYIDYTLGRVMRADITTLKQYDTAVTRECMSYQGHTASRIREEIYRRHYLGRAALQERREFLIAECLRLEGELARAEREEKEAAAAEDCCVRILRWLPELRYLFPSVENCALLKGDLEKAEEECAGIDTRSFRELEERRLALEKQLDLLREDDVRLQNRKGALGASLTNHRHELEDHGRELEEREERIRIFAGEHPLMIDQCEDYARERFAAAAIADLSASYESTLKNFRTRTETLKREYNKLVAGYSDEFHYLLGLDPKDNGEAESLLKRLETSELPEYREKIARAYRDAEREFKDHFISRLNEHIEEARESFHEINDILRTLHFGRDQYRFDLQELAEKKGLIAVIRQSARIPSAEEGLFSQLTGGAEQRAARNLFERILNAPLDSKELREICDYRSYFHYDIRIRETDSLDESGKPVELSLSRVLKEKSGGESQTPYYVAIAASFYRFYKARADNTVRLVIFDEAFNRMDDERIGKILSFYQDLKLQILTSVPPEKIEAISPYMDRINIISRYGSAVKIRDCHRNGENPIKLEP
jgi:energy-coupling factor transporter ATP-binding protein EcfA2